jgi:D-mannonate dehydratase
VTASSWASRGRDEDLDNLLESFRNTGRAEIPVQCYNWMVHFISFSKERPSVST